MAGSKEGAAKARETILKKNPDFYRNIGGQSWKNPERSRKTGFALLDEKEHKKLSQKGGKVTKEDYHTSEAQSRRTDTGE